MNYNKIKLITMLIVLSCFMAGCSTKKVKEIDKKVKEIEDVSQYSNMSVDDLTRVMGKPTSKETWTNKTSKGNFEVTTWMYDKNSNHYEFIIADGMVVRLSLYSEKYWTNEGKSFSYQGKTKEILKMFNIKVGKNAKEVTDNNLTYTLSNVNDKIEEFDIQDINQKDKSFGFIKVTYNLDYFD